MKARGKDYYTHQTHDGDWECGDLPGEDGIRLSDAGVKYYFKVPAYMYDQKLIEKFRVKIKVDKVDWATGSGFATAPRLYCYDFEYGEFDYWYEFSQCGDGDYRWYEATTPGIYPDDDEEHIAHPGGWEEYRIPIEIRAPDGEGGAPDDDDAEVDIDEIQVTLFLKKGMEILEPKVVTLYEHTAYRGKSLIRTDSDSTLGDDDFNDIASSIKVASGCKATLYEAADYGGASIVKTSDDSTLGNDNFNDIASSIKVEGCGFDFGNVYLCTNDSTMSYNKSKNQTFRFKNSAARDMNWKIEDYPSWIKFEGGTSGTLIKDSTQEIKVWLEPDGNPGDYKSGFWLYRNNGKGDAWIKAAWIKVSGTAYKTAYLSHVGPAMGSNNRVNVAEGKSVQYEVKADGPFYPGATLPASGYRWKIETNNFGVLSDPKRSYAFPTSGLYDVYCKSCEKANGTEVNSDVLS
ncbi:MAG: peptidase inhibitor family I36 protein, partial [Candidatus Desantisbacteria bacterium]